MKYSLADLRIYLSEQDVILGRGEYTFSNVSDIKGRNAETLDWLGGSSKNPLDYISNSPARYIICPMLDPQSIPADILSGKTLILTGNPRLLFAKVVNGLFVKHPSHSISNTAIISPDAKIGKNVHIGDHCNIGKVVIGDDTVIMGNCTVCDGVIIGEKVLIKPGVCLGLEGFGFVRDAEHRFVSFPQLGGLEIHDHVEIGAYTCIDKGALSTTIIGKGTKIGAMVKIAHNCIIGESCFIGAQAFMGGSSVIGDRSWIAPGVMIRDQITIGEGSFCGLGAVVVKNVGNDELWVGNPARFVRKIGE